MRNGDKCENCSYFYQELYKHNVADMEAIGWSVDTQQLKEQTCRRNPPTVQGQPSTHKDNWCGEHRRTAEKEGGE